MGGQFQQIQAGGGHQKASIQGVLGGQLHDVALAIAVIPQHGQGPAPGLVGLDDAGAEGGPLFHQADGQLLDVLGRGHAHPQGLHQLAGLKLGAGHGQGVRHGHGRRRGQGDALLARKLRAGTAETQSALELHHPLRAVAEEGGHASAAILGVLDGVADLGCGLGRLFSHRMLVDSGLA